MGNIPANQGSRVTPFRPKLPVKPIKGFAPKIKSGDLLTTPAKVAKQVLGNPLSPKNWLGSRHSSNRDGSGFGRQMNSEERAARKFLLP
jgi:hypothetical protein